jgi:hypothetical protein
MENPFKQPINTLKNEREKGEQRRGRRVNMEDA